MTTTNTMQQQQQQHFDDDDPFQPPPPPKRHSYQASTTSATATNPFVSDADGYAYPHRKSSSATSTAFPLPASSSTTTSTPSSPTKVSTVLPLQTPPPIKPNAHPYAIKTTSTGILTRSSSNAASPHYKDGHRYVPPPSPSPTASSFAGGPPSPTKSSHHQQTSSGGSLHEVGRKSNAYRGHRYSQSLTDVSGSPAPSMGPPPRPLPVPPNFTGGSANPIQPDYTGRSMSASPTKSARFLELQAEFTGNGEDKTPRQHERTRMKRAETLPSGMEAPFPFVFPSTRRQNTTADGEQLPEDPKTWTPAQVAAYLRNSSLDSSANPEDLANFVLERQIAGRAFLRLASSSDERTELDHALRNASRTLRQSSLRGRIWGFNATAENSNDLNGPYSQRPRSDSVSSASSSGSFSDNNPFSSNTHRPTGRSSGRVRGMVETLERSSSLSGSEREDDDYRRTSRSSSPTKHKALPTRGRVNDLFDPQSTPVESLEEEDNGRNATIKGHGNPNMSGQHASNNILFANDPHHHHQQHPQHGYQINKELPRLLPLPPTFTGGSGDGLSPMNTGSTVGAPGGGVMHTHTAGGPVLSPMNTGGVEFGFRAGSAGASASPGKQRSEKASSRMLPVPPALSPLGFQAGAGALPHGQPHSQHPHPHSPNDGGGVLHHPTPRRIASPAAKSLISKGGRGGGGMSESEGETSDVERGRAEEEEGEGEEEPSIEELLMKEETRGAKAWEMDVGIGETVKKIVTVPSGTGENRQGMTKLMEPSTSADLPAGSSSASTSTPASASTSATSPSASTSDALPTTSTVNADMSFVNGRTGRRAKGLRPKVRNSGGGPRDMGAGGGGSPRKSPRAVSPLKSPVGVGLDSGARGEDVGLDLSTRREGEGEGSRKESGGSGSDGGASASGSSASEGEGQGQGRGEIRKARVRGPRGSREEEQRERKGAGAEEGNGGEEVHPVYNSRRYKQSVKRKSGQGVGVMALFDVGAPSATVEEASVEAALGTSEATSTDHLEPTSTNHSEPTSSSHSEKLSEELKRREKNVEEREEAVKGREEAVRERERVVGEREEEAGRREGVVDERSADLDDRVVRIEERVVAVDLRERDLEERVQAVEERSSAVEGRAKAIEERETTVGQREAGVVQRENAVEQREGGVAAREEAVKERESVVVSRERVVGEREASIDAREKKLSEREEEVKEREEEVERARIKLEEERALVEEARKSTKLGDGDAATGLPAAGEVQARQNGPNPDDEDTFSLATRLFKRLASPFWGGHLFAPSEGDAVVVSDSQATSTSDSATTQTENSDSTATQIGEPSTSNESAGGPSSSRRASRSFPGTLLNNRETTGYLVLLGIGVVAVMLRVLTKRFLFGYAIGKVGVRGVTHGMKR
ncbi:hypothetical protein CC2G_006900 [Coprinopsis cinerea AmutBmut pab1-1]|nr:hypothetical protein CC2G_006900 [Coprinopsis cinerea AmutBmut pab1-1]